MRRVLMRAFVLVFLLACADGTSVGAPFTPQTASLERDRALDDIRRVEDHRLGNDTQLLSYLTSAQDPIVIAAAIRAAGRIGDASYHKFVTAQVAHEDARVRLAAVEACARMGIGHEAVLSRLDKEPDAHALGGALRALGDLKLASALPAIEPHIASKNSDVLAGAAYAWVSLVDAAEPKGPLFRTFLQCTTRAGREAVLCAAALRAAAKKWGSLETWVPYALFAETFDAVSAVEVRHALLGALRRYTPAKAQLVGLTRHPSLTLRAGAYSALALRLDADVADLLPGLDDPEAAVRQTVLSLLEPPFDAVTTVRAAELLDGDASEWVKAEAINALAKEDAALALHLAEKHYTAVIGPLTEAYVNALDKVGDLAALDNILSSDPYGPAVYAAAAYLARANAAGVTTWPPASLESAAKLALKDPTNDRLLAVATIAAKMADADLRDFLLAQWSTLPIAPETLTADRRLALLQAAVAPEHLPIVEEALADSQAFVSQAAAERFRVITGKERKPRTNSIVDDVTPSGAEIAALANRRVLLRTRHGDISLKLLVQDAPVTAHKFVQRVKAGFYNGLTFHRVIPGFVAQGGDPTGSGSGSAAKFVREEWSSAGHRRGTVGIATSGRDTGSCQFFINLVDNYYLDAAYTVFAEVDAGMDAAERLERGDVIREAIVAEIASPGDQ